MLDGLKLKRGDLVVRYGRMLEVTRIDEETVFLKPHFGAANNRGGLNYSLPLKNMAMIKLRRAASKEKLDRLLKAELNLIDNEGGMLSLNLKDPLENNDVAETIKVVKMLWREKKANSGSLPSGRLSIYQEALEQLTEEMAAVRGLTLEKAKIKLSAALKTDGK